MVSKHAWSDIQSIGQDEFISSECIYGGHLISQSIYCAYQTVPESFDINSFHSYLVKTGTSNTPITFKVKRIRDGRSFIFRAVQLFQNDDVIHHFEFTFRKRPEILDLKITQVRFPSVPQPERLKSLDELRNEFESLGYKRRPKSYSGFKDLFVEIRPCNGMEFLLGPQRPILKQNVWIRYRPDANKVPNYNCLVMAYLSDIGLAYTGAFPFPKTAFCVLSSIDHSGWLHKPEFDSNEFMLLEQECLMHTNGKSLIHSRLWTRNEDLIASFSQEAAVETIEPIKLLPNSKL